MHIKPHRLRRLRQVKVVSFGLASEFSAEVASWLRQKQQQQQRPPSQKGFNNHTPLLVGFAVNVRDVIDNAGILQRFRQTWKRRK
mmetsp:Transcript_6921/g.12269  ORF Transcript_6921/g.12269 Transcript_6921/m.12269 type:complete len:85 (-) Transcript_6921:5500-5754(-)